MKRLSARKGRIDDIKPHSHSTTIVATIPTRGIIGFEFELMNLTSGHGIFSHLFKEYAPHCGAMSTRTTGTLVSTESGEATGYALDTIQVRGKLFVAPGDPVYDGMLVGENPRTDDLPVNPTRSKQLTNFRAAGGDKGIQLTPPIRFSLERAIEYIAPDELVEATPKSIRLRKRTLDHQQRMREVKKMKDLAENSCFDVGVLGCVRSGWRCDRCFGRRWLGVPRWLLVISSLWSVLGAYHAER